MATQKDPPPFVTPKPTFEVQHVSSNMKTVSITADNGQQIIVDISQRGGMLRVFVADVSREKKTMRLTSSEYRYADSASLTFDLNEGAQR